MGRNWGLTKFLLSYGKFSESHGLRFNGKSILSFIEAQTSQEEKLWNTDYGQLVVGNIA